MSEEPSVYPEYTPLREMPITASIPYLYRWKILHLKLLLADIQTLADKYQIATAKPLMIAVCKETEDLCAQLLLEITNKQYERERLTK